jgi:phenylacetic acid degradation operon negative regulatory protein
VPETTIPTRVLVLGMAHDDGTILASELYPVAEACGQTPEQVRSCLRRLVAEGLYIRQGSGTTASFRATERGMSSLGTSTERTRLAYVQDAAGRGWDRQWRLVAFAIPEQHRAARDTFRDYLRLLGGATIQGGLYVSAHPWQKDVKAEAERLGLAHLVSIAVTDDLEIGGERDPRELARRLWRIDELAQRYISFITEFDYVPEALSDMRRQKLRLPDTTFLPGALRMAVAFGECFNDDPLLPPELLPRPWPGRAARDLLLRSRRLALSIRQVHGGPLLFRDFDDAIELIP